MQHPIAHALVAIIAKSITTTLSWESRDTKGIDIHGTLRDKKPAVKCLHGQCNLIRSMVLTRLYHMSQHQRRDILGRARVCPDGNGLGIEISIAIDHHQIDRLRASR